MSAEQTPDDMGGAASADTSAELVEALQAVLPYVRGWAGVIRRQYGHHSQESAAVDAALRRARAAIAKAEGR